MAAKMIDPSLYVAAGIDPKTGLPAKLVESAPCSLKNDIKRALRVKDEQDAVNRYKWYNLPCDLSSQELERLLYYKGQLCFFYCEPLDKFFFMPYALDGTIDFYGRYNTIHPVPMTSGTTEDEKKAYKAQLDYLSTLRLKVYYDIPTQALTYDDITHFAVLLGDYTNQLSQTIIPRQQLNDGILDVMAECVPMMRTNLHNSTGVSAVRVGTQDEYSNVKAANEAIDQAALNGQRYIPVVGFAEFQDLAGGQVAKSEEYLMAMQSLDNLRLQWYGISTGSVFDKKAYVNRDQTAKMGSNIDSPLLDGLFKRQRFCDIVNGITGLGISCELDESTINTDENGDGLMHDESDQTGIQGDQSYEHGGAQDV